MKGRRLVGVAVALAAITGCAQVPPSSPGAQPEVAAETTEPAASRAPSEPTCSDVAASLSTAQQVGQLLMVGVYGALDGHERETITSHEIGSVILMGNYDTSVPETRELTQAIADLGVVTPVLIAVDQEGGQVQRLKGRGFDKMPSAAEQAKLPEDAFAEDAAIWAEQLRAAGVNLVLAPVADTVPEKKKRTNQPIGRLDRGYGSDPEVVARKVTTFVKAFSELGVGTSLKHFPTLGEVTGNTDFTQGVTDGVTTADSASLIPFRAGIEAGAETVMMSTAVYPRIDPDAPAAFSPKVIGLLRDGLGFTGVIVSDDLGVAVSAKSVPVRERALRFVSSGGDLAITVDPDLASEMASGLVKAAQKDAAVAARVTESAARVLAMKSQLGLGAC